MGVKHLVVLFDGLILLLAISLLFEDSLFFLQLIFLDYTLGLFALLNLLLYFLPLFGLKSLLELADFLQFPAARILVFFLLFSLGLE